MNQKLNQSSCYIYLHSSFMQDEQICKIGISNNVEKRLREFNNGIRHRSKLFPRIKNVVFYSHARWNVHSRNEAKKIELLIKRNLKNLLISDFGSEVFSIDIQTASKLVEKQILEAKYD